MSSTSTTRRKRLFVPFPDGSDKCPFESWEDYARRKGVEAGKKLADALLAEFRKRLGLSGNARVRRARRARR